MLLVNSCSLARRSVYSVLLGSTTTIRMEGQNAKIVLEERHLQRAR
jgi:hypothetical protein